MTRLGLGVGESLDMDEESAGLRPSRAGTRARYRQPWYPGGTVVLGIGQGYMQATPLQLAQATALVATRGKWIRPHLARSVGSEAPVDHDPVPDIQLRDPRFWDYATHGMEQVLHGEIGRAHV